MAEKSRTQLRADVIAALPDNITQQISPQDSRESIVDTIDSLYGTTGFVTVNVRDPEWGAVGNGVADDLPAFNAALAAGTHVYVPPGDYLLSGPLSIPETVLKFWGAGRRQSRLFGTTGVEVALVQYEGSNPTLLSNVFTDHTIQAGDLSFPMSSSPVGVNEGLDVCVVQGLTRLWSDWLQNFMSGEMPTIHKVNGTTLHIAGSFYDSYAYDDVTLGLFPFKPLVIQDLTVESDLIAMQINKVNGLVMRDVECLSTSAGAGEVGEALRVFRSVNGYLDNLRCEVISDQTDNRYGLSLANCQNMRIQGGSFIAAKHAITFSSLGGTPGLNNIKTISRGTRVDGATIQSVDFSGQTGIEPLILRGGTEFINVSNCHISGGSVGIGGDNHQFSNNEVVLPNRTLSNIAYRWTEQKGMNCVISGGIIRATKTDDAFAFYSNSFDAPMVNDSLLTISDVLLDWKGTPGFRPIFWDQEPGETPGANYFDLVLNNVHLRYGGSGDAFFLQADVPGGGSEVLRNVTLSGCYSDFVDGGLDWFLPPGSMTGALVINHRLAQFRSGVTDQNSGRFFTTSSAFQDFMFIPLKTEEAAQVIVDLVHRRNNTSIGRTQRLVGFFRNDGTNLVQDGLTQSVPEYDNGTGTADAQFAVDNVNKVIVVQVAGVDTQTWYHNGQADVMTGTSR